ncbi:tetratricopeptide repeat-containing sulfotransferase family protein [Candidatus Thiodictyon syntrophicum]|jgi:tetratricopeptide (TPR) repeat protein|nr:sulfotransferase [Candidatus Thiodictyon syntrophicum]
MAVPKDLAGLLRQADQLRNTGRLREAETLCRRLLQAEPGLAPAWECLALIAHGAGQAAQAAELMAKAAAAAPQVASYRRNLCELFRRLGRLDEALAAGREAVRLAPADAVAHYNLGIALDDHGDLAEARAVYERAVVLDPGHNLAWNNLGSVRNRLGDEAAALAAYRQAAAIDPRHAEAQNNIAAILIDRGELDEAKERLRAAIDARPDFLEAHQNISTLTRYTADDPHYRFLEEQLAVRDRLEPEQRLRLLFALGKAREDLGRYDLALIAYREANRLKRATLAFDEERSERLCQALIAACSADTCRPDPASPADPTPIFIVGMPRSGTTLLEQVLSSHPDCHGAGELKDFHAVVKAHPKVGEMDQAAQWVPRLTDEDFRDIGAAYLERLRGHHAGARRITDKMPGNFHYLGFIHRALPGARVIHSMRDPMDSCWSNFTRLFNDTMEFAYDLGDVGRYYNRYLQMMQHWDRVLPAGVLLHLHYEAMVADLEGQARRVIAHVGLPWDDACLRFHENRRPVRTASVAQVRKPIYSSSVGRWRAYPDGLLVLREIVGDDYPHGLGGDAAGRRSAGDPAV